MTDPLLGSPGDHSVALFASTLFSHLLTSFFFFIMYYAILYSYALIFLFQIFIIDIIFFFFFFYSSVYIFHISVNAPLFSC